MHPSCQSLLVQRTKTMALRRSHHRRSGRALARYLPETAQRVASRRPTANLWTATLTCAAVWAREVLRGLVNHPSINGKDGIAALSKGIPSGCVYSGGPDIWRRHGAVGSASVSRSRWHQVIAALTARCACRGLSPAGVLAWPCPEP
jgi:hypothetical protein